MLRFLILVFLALLAAALFRLVQGVLGVFSAGRGAPGKPAVSRMVKCGWCGVFVPEAGALRDGERSYCSREHLESGQHGGAA